MKTAIVYDRVNKWGGAERVLLAIHELFPEAPLYTSVYNKETAPWADAFPIVHASFLQKIPTLRTRHEVLAPFMPHAFESFDFSEYDLVISVTSEAAKGVITGSQTKHISYVLTPTRYLWSGYDDYFKNDLLKITSKPFVKYLHNWDRVVSNRPDRIVSISTEVQDRIKMYYGRDSVIVHPPVSIESFSHDLPEKSDKFNNLPKNYYLVVSRLVGYKKVDLVVNAFNKLKESLVVVGIGSEEKKLKEIAGNNIYFTGYLEDSKLGHIYKNAKAFIFPQFEDFGITAVEAQYFGVPVIAFSKGGSRDTVIDKVTGVLFNKQEVDSLTEAILRFKKTKFEKMSIMKNAERFSKDNFKKKFMYEVNQLI